jgi:gamma-glutamylputrescine oxidase
MSISYWESTVFYEPYDYLIVGGGITGCSLAMELKKKSPSAHIAILEKDFYPTGASSRNAGFACFGSVSELLDDLNTVDESELKRLIKSRFDGLNLLKDTVPTDVMGFSMCGGHELFTDKQHYEQCVESIPMFNRWLKEIANLDSTYKAVEINGYPAIFNKYEGYLHSGKLVRWLHQHIRDIGVELRWSCNVQTAHQDRVSLLTGHEINAKNVILATNGFTDNILNDVRIKPARGYVFVTNELQNNRWNGTWHYDKGYIYFRNVGNRLLLGGGRNVDFDGECTTEDKINPMVKAYLIQFVRDVLKIEDNWTIDYEWTGIMGFGQSKTPSISKNDSGVWVAAGLGGMGVALGMQFGKDAANIITQ